MKEAIRQYAAELGFDSCRFTHAGAPVSSARFQAWLSEGRHGSMAYLARNAHKRVEPRLVLQDARSLVCLAVRYSGDKASPAPATSTRPVIARYARNLDYHHVLAFPLKTLAAKVTELGGASARSLWYVDTGPLLERDLAQRAGLGFIGKHTNLISRSLGNWFFIAEIITTVELEPDLPEVNRCGNCTRCIQACPTQAILAPFQLDARRCISYLTIENKGPIPLEFRRALGSRLFGCDDCLAVCPWNRFAREGGLMREHYRAELSEPELCQLLVLDEAAFAKRFVGTPMFRTKRAGLIRNACVVLGNIGTACALPALRKASSDPEPIIAEHAVWAIEEITRRGMEL